MLRVHQSLLFSLALGLGLAVACFTPPNDEVLFSCEFDDDDRCPPDYECRSDNCCHRVGTDADSMLGECALGGNSGMTGTGTGTGTDSTESGTDSSGETGTDSTGSTGSDTTG